ncbi:alpha/beta hydrolase family protein [Posidoniimonas corsicana]|nr:prolyl oligopeptidase family serine peptidase [Posidoniimonas corsicana]
MRYRTLAVVLMSLVAGGCGAPVDTTGRGAASAPSSAKPMLVDVRRGFETRLVSRGEEYGPPDRPDGDEFLLVSYPSAVGDLAAYVTPDPGDGGRHPAIVWITGGDNNTIGDVWTPRPRGNDQSASAFRKAGVVMMFPSQRGGNDNPGRREGFLGEVDDILAATDYLVGLPYVDPEQVYLGGHSTGGTMAMLVGESTDRYRAVFSLGPVATPYHYGGDYLYCDPEDDEELTVRAPIVWLHCVKRPMYVFEGGERGNWESIQLMAADNTNPNVRFLRVPGHDHFSVIAPLAEVLAEQIVQGQIEVDEQLVSDLQ